MDSKQFYEGILSDQEKNDQWAEGAEHLVKLKKLAEADLGSVLKDPSSWPLMIAGATAGGLIAKNRVSSREEHGGQSDAEARLNHMVQQHRNEPEEGFFAKMKNRGVEHAHGIAKAFREHPGYGIGAGVATGAALGFGTAKLLGAGKIKQAFALPGGAAAKALAGRMAAGGGLGGLAGMSSSSSGSEGGHPILRTLAGAGLGAAAAGAGGSRVVRQAVRGAEAAVPTAAHAVEAAVPAATHAASAAMPAAQSAVRSAVSPAAKTGAKSALRSAPKSNVLPQTPAGMSAAEASQTAKTPEEFYSKLRGSPVSAEQAHADFYSGGADAMKYRAGEGVPLPSQLPSGPSWGGGDPQKLQQIMSNSKMQQNHPALHGRLNDLMKQQGHTIQAAPAAMPGSASANSGIATNAGGRPVPGAAAPAPTRVETKLTRGAQPNKAAPAAPTDPSLAATGAMPAAPAPAPAPAPGQQWNDMSQSKYWGAAGRGASVRAGELPRGTPGLPPNARIKIAGVRFDRVTFMKVAVERKLAYAHA